MVVSLERDLCLSYTLHTLTFSMRINSVLTPCKQGAVLSRYSIGLGNEYELLTHTLSNVRYISHLGHTPNTAEPHAFKQGFVVQT